MARISFIIVLTFIILSCKRDDFGPIPESVIGQWQMVSQEKQSNGVGVWENVPVNDSLYIFFSATGELVNSAGERKFCGPSQLIVNGKLHKIKMVSPIEVTHFIGICAECITWELRLNGEELLINSCSPSYRKKFIKVK